MPLRYWPILGKNSRWKSRGADRALALDSRRCHGRCACQRQGTAACGNRCRGRLMKIDQIDLKAYGHFTNQRCPGRSMPISTSFAVQTKPAKQRSGVPSTAPCLVSRNDHKIPSCMTPRNCALVWRCSQALASVWPSCGAKGVSIPCSSTTQPVAKNSRMPSPTSESGNGLVA